MLTEMEKDFEGYNRAVKAVMHAAEKGTLRGVRGPVANLIKTGDRYALAIETALGAAAQNIVVDTQSCGARPLSCCAGARPAARRSCRSIPSVRCT